MQNRTYDDGREQELIMTVSEFEESICKSRDEGYRGGLRWKAKYEALKQALQSIIELGD